MGVERRQPPPVPLLEPLSSQPEPEPWPRSCREPDWPPVIPPVVPLVPVVSPTPYGSSAVPPVIADPLSPPMPEPLDMPERWRLFPDLNRAEVATLGGLTFFVILIGVYPLWLLDAIDSFAGPFVGRP